MIFAAFWVLLGIAYYIWYAKQVSDNLSAARKINGVVGSHHFCRRDVGIIQKPKKRARENWTINQM